MSDVEIASPCIGVCTIYEEHMPRAGNSVGLCAGCFRSRAEIEQWRSMNNTQKQELLPQLQQRAAHHQATAPRPSAVRAARRQQSED